MAVKLSRWTFLKRLGASHCSSRGHLKRSQPSTLRTSPSSATASHDYISTNFHCYQALSILSIAEFQLSYPRGRTMKRTTLSSWQSAFLTLVLGCPPYLSHLLARAWWVNGKVWMEDAMRAPWLTCKAPSRWEALPITKKWISHWFLRGFPEFICCSFSFPLRRNVQNVELETIPRRQRWIAAKRSVLPGCQTKSQSSRDSLKK